MLKRISNWYKIFYLEIHLEEAKECLEEMYKWNDSQMDRTICRNYIRRIQKLIKNLKM